MQQSETKVALITGAAKRLGATTASVLHAAGYRVIVHYRSATTEAVALVETLNASRADSAIALQADLTDSGALNQLATRAQQHWGRLDVLINNASAFYPTPVGQIREQDWDLLVGSNLKAPLFLSQQLAPELQHRRGCIINMVDIHAERPLPNHSVYCLAKAGLVALTKSLAFELGPELRVNAVAPGAILWPESSEEDEERRKILERIALQRAGKPMDIARTILFLVDDAPYITGQVIPVDGGRTLTN